MRKSGILALGAMLFALVTCGGNGGDPPSPTPTTPRVKYRVFGINFSPYVGSQNPNDGSVVDESQLTQQIGAVAAYTKNIRSFGCAAGLQNLPRIARRFGLGVYVGAWIGNDTAANDRELQACIALAQADLPDAVVIGSEALLRNDVTPAQLITYINRFRAAVPSVPVTTADTYLMLENNPSVVAACDFVFANYYPFWEGVEVSRAVASLHAADALLRAKYAPKEVIVSETGWKSRGGPVGQAVPSLENARLFFLNFESWAQAGQRKTFYFEAHDEPWKGADDGWGIWDEQLVMKPGMIDVFDGATMPDTWTCGAAPGGPGTPEVQFTSVPAVGSRDLLRGQAWHVAPADFHIVVYIRVSGNWWVKPYAESPLTTISCDGSWSVNIVTGGDDALATEIAAFLIPNTYSPPILLGARSLPASLYAAAVADASVAR